MKKLLLLAMAVVLVGCGKSEQIAELERINADQRDRLENAIGWGAMW